MKRNTTRLLQDIGYASIAPFFKKAKGAFLIPIITKWVGAEAFGVWKQFSITSGFLVGLATVGSGQVVLRYLAPMERARRYSAHLLAIISLVLAVTCAVAGTLLLSSNFSAERIFGQDAPVVLVYLLAGYLPILAISNRLVTFLKSRRRFDVTAPLSVVRDLGSILLLGTLVFKTGNIKLAIIGFVLWEFGALLIVVHLARKKGSLKVVFPNFSDLKKYLAFGSPIVLVTVGARLAEFGDRYLIVSILGVEEVGMYSVAYAAGAVGILFWKPLSHILLPDFSVLISQGKENMLRRRIEKLVKYFIASQVGVIIIISFVGEHIIVLLSNSEFLSASPVLKIVPFGIVCYGLLQIGAQVLKAKTKPMLVGIIWVMTGILNVAVNAVTIPLFGLVGAAIATVLSYAIGASMCWWFVINSYPVKLSRRFIIGIVVSSLFSSFILYSLNKMTEIGSFFTLLIGVLIVLILYPTTLIFMGIVTDREREIFTDMLGHKWGKIIRFISYK